MPPKKDVLEYRIEQLELKVLALTNEIEGAKRWLMLSAGAALLSTLKLLATLVIPALK